MISIVLGVLTRCCGVLIGCCVVTWNATDWCLTEFTFESCVTIMCTDTVKGILSRHFTKANGALTSTTNKINGRYKLSNYSSVLYTNVRPLSHSAAPSGALQRLLSRAATELLLVSYAQSPTAPDKLSRVALALDTSLCQESSSLLPCPVG